MAAPCINYMQYPWGYAVPVRVCSTRESYHQYLWVISSVPVRICSTRESYPQYPWGYAVPVSHIISTRESYLQYPWVISSVPVRIWLTGTDDMTHGYWWYDSRVMHILTGTAYSLYRVGSCTTFWQYDRYFLKVYDLNFRIIFVVALCRKGVLSTQKLNLAARLITAVSKSKKVGTLCYMWN